jgi:hypothetical protein
MGWWVEGPWGDLRVWSIPVLTPFPNPKHNHPNRTGARVILLEKEARVGGNSAKATSGINGWGTRVQAQQGVQGACHLMPDV